jgi:predicted NBD/HSP70 family sugar kinase
VDIERVTPLLFAAIGVAMIVVAAFDYLGTGIAVAFTVLGVGLVALGGCLRLLEGPFRLGPHGLEASLRQREDEVIETVRQADPGSEPLVREVIRYVDPMEDILDAKIRQQIEEHERHRRKRRELIRELTEKRVAARQGGLQGP